MFFINRACTLTKPALQNKDYGVKKAVATLVMLLRQANAKRLILQA